MTWETVPQPRRASHKINKAGVSLCCTSPEKRARLLILVIRDAPSWWVPGAKVNIGLGRDENAGKLLVTPGGEFTVSRCPGMRSKEQEANAQLIIRADTEDFWKIEDGAHRATACQYEKSEDRVIVKLPSWAVV